NTGGETARTRPAHRRRGGSVAARGARAAAGEAVADRHAGNDIFGSKCAPARRLSATPSAARLCRGDKLCHRIPFGGRSRRSISSPGRGADSKECRYLGTEGNPRRNWREECHFDDSRRYDGGG